MTNKLQITNLKFQTSFLNEIGYGRGEKKIEKRKEEYRGHPTALQHSINPIPHLATKP